MEYFPKKPVITSEMIKQAGAIEFFEGFAMIKQAKNTRSTARYGGF